MNDDLMLEEVQQFASHSSYDRVRQLAGQLAATMQRESEWSNAACKLELENRRLLGALMEASYALEASGNRNAAKRIENSLRNKGSYD